MIRGPSLRGRVGRHPLSRHLERQALTGVGTHRLHPRSNTRVPAPKSSSKPKPLHGRRRVSRGYPALRGAGNPVGGFGRREPSEQSVGSRLSTRGGYAGSLLHDSRRVGEERRGAGSHVYVISDRIWHKPHLRPPSFASGIAPPLPQPWPSLAPALSLPRQRTLQSGRPELQMDQRRGQKRICQSTWQPAGSPPAFPQQLSGQARSRHLRRLWRKLSASQKRSFQRC